MGYKSDAIRGVSFVSAFRYTTRGVAFLRTLVLARILSPRQFGIYGVANLILALLEIITETGINVFLIQKRESHARYLNTAWVVSIVRGIIISLAIVALARPISSFFNSPESFPLLLLIALVPLIRGFINPSIVEFQKDLKFGKEFWFRLVVFLFDSGIAVVLALATRHANSLIWGLIAGSILELTMSFVFIKPRPKLEFDFSKLAEVLHTGKWLTGAGIFQFLFRQGDDIVVGKILGETSLGLYQVAYKISTLPISEVTDVFNKVAFPLYVKISSSKVRLYRAFLINSAFVVTLAVILGVFIFIFAESLVSVALGSQWLEIVPLLRVLSIFGVIQAITNSIHSLLLALGKQKYVTLLTAVAIAAMGVVIIPLTQSNGLLGAAVAPLIGSVVALPFMIFTLKQSMKDLKQ